MLKSPFLGMLKKVYVCMYACMYDATTFRFSRSVVLVHVRTY